MGNNTAAQRNPLCAWFPGSVGTCFRARLSSFLSFSSIVNLNFATLLCMVTTGDAETKLFQCAKVLIGQYVFVQMVGVESSLSLCEVEVFSAGAGNPVQHH